MHEAALDAVLVHVLEVVLGAREVVDDRLDRVVDAVERPRLDLADVAVAVDHVPLDSVRQGHDSPVVSWSGGCARSSSAAARHSSGSVNSRRGDEGLVRRRPRRSRDRAAMRLDGVAAASWCRGPSRWTRPPRGRVRERHLDAPVGRPQLALALAPDDGRRLAGRAGAADGQSRCARSPRASAARAARIWYAASRTRSRSISGEQVAARAPRPPRARRRGRRCGR